GTERAYVTAEVGTTATASPLNAGSALVVRTQGGQLYLIWNDHRLRVPSAAALSALGLSAAPVSLVGSGWLNAVPAGPDVGPPDVPGRGGAGPKLNGKASVIGEVYRASGVDGATQTQFYVMRADGLSPLTAIGATLLLADPRTAIAYPG